MPKASVEKIIFEPTRVKPEAGRWVMEDGDVPMPEGFTATRGASVAIAPGGWAGNHRHERHEILFALVGDLYLIWRGNDNERHEEKMTRDDGKLQIFSIPSLVPHLIENRSRTTSGALHEWSDILGEAEELQGNDSLRV